MRNYRRPYMPFREQQGPLNRFYGSHFDAIWYIFLALALWLLSFSMVAMPLLAARQAFDTATATVEATTYRPPPPVPTPAPHPTIQTGQWKSCKASWYGEDCGTRTASGEKFREDAMTCAHKRLKFGTVLEVRKAGKVIRVRVTDRGPYVPSDPRRTIDLSKGAFARLAPLSRGVISVEYRKVEASK